MVLSGPFLSKTLETAAVSLLLLGPDAATSCRYGVLGSRYVHLGISQLECPLIDWKHKKTSSREMTSIVRPLPVLSAVSSNSLCLMGAVHPQLPRSFQVLELSTGQAPRRAQGMKTKLKWIFQALMYEQWVLLSLLISRGGKVLACPTLGPWCVSGKSKLRTVSPLGCECQPSFI